MPPTVDVHAHAIVPDALLAMQEAQPEHGPVLLDADGRRWLKYPARERLGPLPDVIFDPDERLRQMDEKRVDRQIIAIPPPNYHYHVAAEVGVDFARIQNDGLLSLSDSNPDRFHVFGALPLQDIEASVAEVLLYNSNTDTEIRAGVRADRGTGGDRAHRRRRARAPRRGDAPRASPRVGRARA